MFLPIFVQKPWQQNVFNIPSYHRATCEPFSKRLNHAIRDFAAHVDAEAVDGRADVDDTVLEGDSGVLASL
jgi:hypothetical protein